MTTQIGRNFKVEVALTFATASAVTAITKADPGVCTLTSHGIADGTVGYWDVAAGMVELDDQAAMTGSAAANTFELEGLVTTNYSTYTAGNFYPAATWGLLEEATSFDIAGGAADELDDSRLHLTQRQSVAGLNASQTITVALQIPTVQGTALTFLTKAARANTKVLIKATSGTTVVAVAYGTPSVPSASVPLGGLGNGQMTIIVPRLVVQPNV